MKVLWHIEPEDIEKVRRFYNLYRDDLVVQQRIERNLSETKPEVSKEQFWYVMVSCLLTTQQRSGPSSPVQKLIETRPFPLAYEHCVEQDDLQNYCQKTLRDFEGIRRFRRIADETSTNLAELERGLWSTTLEKISKLDWASTAQDERRVAAFVADRFKGFGPKQSRNLLQSLGLTRYEIPIDSRVTRWLNDFGFPVRLSAWALSDPNYYNFVSEGVQELCRQSNIYPCVLDAAIFTSFDQGGWSEKNIIW